MTEQCCAVRERQKLKKPRTAPTNTSLLPPCKVCLEPAAGFHYGANTCEACKGFFRRSLLRQTPYRCLGNGNCNIRAGKRKICPKCRHAKCLAIGMSKEAIKTGRYTHAKRTQDVLEYQQMKQLGFTAGLACITDTHITKDSLAASKAVSLSSFPASSESSNNNSSTSEVVSNLSSSPASSSVKLIRSLSPSWELTTSSACVAATSNNLDILQSTVAGTDRLCSLPSLPAVSTTVGQCTLSFQSCVSDRELGSVESREKTASPCSSVKLASPCSSVKLTSPSSSPQSPSRKVSVVSPALPEASTTPSMEMCGDVLDDAECERIITELLMSHAERDTFPCDKLTAQELMERQTACYEACKTRAEVFGHCSSLSNTEYNDIFKRTGLDVDNRQCLMKQMGSMMEESICSYISFIKTIPGFLTLSTKDQINLTRNNRCEYRMLGSAYAYNWDMQVFSLRTGRTECIHQMSKLTSMQILQERFECAHFIQKLGLTKEEVIILQCLVVLTAGHDDLEEPHKVDALQWKMAQCLLWLLQRNGHDANLHFARIISRICKLREVGMSFYHWLKTNSFDRFIAVRSNALMAEWFSSS